jgi:prepilin-type N-terminal cleavage/methylation domain-containing protein
MPGGQDQKKYDQQGLSLIEVLASLVLLSLLAFSMLAIFSPVARWINAARHETTAVHYAAAILENLRSEREKIDPVNAGQTAQEIGLASVCPANGMVAEISLIQAQAAYPNLYDVQVTVTWTEGTVTQSLSLSTVIRKN